jgi:superfamily II DNA or RNA helicase
MDLRGPQQDVLRKYEKYAKAPNVAAELPTGTGKTTVGLLIAEWYRRMDKRVAFLSL